jgi:D-alanine-D-alanine ligase
MDLSRYRNLTIGVLMGGISSEREISLHSGARVFQAMQNLGLKAVSIDVTGNIVSDILKTKIDLAFIALHGPYGEDGCIQGILEWLKIRYTGSDVTSSGISMNKLLTKKILKSSGITVPDYVDIDLAEVEKSVRKAGDELGYPLVLKPCKEGSSIGVELIRAKRNSTPVSAKILKIPASACGEIHKGKEVTVGVLGDERSQHVFPILELRPKHEFYDFEAKYTKGFDGLRHSRRPRGRPDDPRPVYGQKSFVSLGLRGVARIGLHDRRQ